MNPLQNHRAPGENFKSFQARRRTMNAAIKLHLKGRVRYAVSQIVTLPLAGVDAQADKAVLEGKFRDLQLARLKDGKEIRLARTKGVPYTTTPYLPGTKRCQRRLLREFPTH